MLPKAREFVKVRDLPEQVTDCRLNIRLLATAFLTRATAIWCSDATQSFLTQVPARRQQTHGLFGSAAPEKT